LHRNEDQQEVERQSRRARGGQGEGTPCHHPASVLAAGERQSRSILQACLQQISKAKTQTGFWSQSVPCRLA